MKIAICTNFFAPMIGGAELVVKKIAEYFLSKNNEVCIFTRFLVNRKSRNINGVSICDYNPSHSGEYLRKLKKYKPDLIFIYSDVFDHIFPTISEFNNVSLAFCGGSKFLSNNAFVGVLKKNINNIKSFVCHIKNDKDYELAKKLGVLERTYVIGNGVEIEEFDNSNKSRKDLGCDDSNKWVLNVSNFFPGKGQNHLIKILRLMKTRPLTYLQVCSSSGFPICEQLESNWKKICVELLDNGVKVVLMKNKKRNDVVAAFKNSNLFAFTSEKESFGLVFLESMTASTPWLSSNVGIAEQLSGGEFISSRKDKNNNCIFEDFLINKFAERADYLLDNQHIGINGRKMVEEKYQWKNILPLYDSIL